MHFKFVFFTLRLYYVLIQKLSCYCRIIFHKIIKRLLYLYTLHVYTEVNFFNLFMLNMFPFNILKYI